MHTHETIAAFCQSFGFKPNALNKLELKDLPTLLHPDEELLGLVSGFLKHIHNKSLKAHGLVFVTNKRVVFYRKSLIGTVTKEEMPISRITSISFRSNLLSSSIAVISPSNDSLIEQCDKAVADRFVKVVQRLISDLSVVLPTAAAQVQTGQTSPIQPQVSNIDQLEKLFTLKEKGILTDEEFQTQKAKLLS